MMSSKIGSMQRSCDRQKETVQKDVGGRMYAGITRELNVLFFGDRLPLYLQIPAPLVKSLQLPAE
jgi:hypothetical protein